MTRPTARVTLMSGSPVAWALVAPRLTFSAASIPLAAGSSVLRISPEASRR